MGNEFNYNENNVKSILSNYTSINDKELVKAYTEFSDVYELTKNDEILTYGWSKIITNFDKVIKKYDSISIWWKSYYESIKKLEAGLPDNTNFTAVEVMQTSNLKTHTGLINSQPDIDAYNSRAAIGQAERIKEENERRAAEESARQTAASPSSGGGLAGSSSSNGYLSEEEKKQRERDAYEDAYKAGSSLSNKTETAQQRADRERAAYEAAYKAGSSNSIYLKEKMSYANGQTTLVVDGHMITASNITSLDNSRLLYLANDPNTYTSTRNAAINEAASRGLLSHGGSSGNFGNSSNISSHRYGAHGGSTGKF